MREPRLPEAAEGLAASGRVGALPDALGGGSGEVRGSRRGLVATFAAIIAAFLASLCCIGPLVFVFLGVGAGLASTFEPLRPVFTVVTVVLLALGFYAVYGRRQAARADAGACEPDGTCRVPRRRRRDEVLLWLATALAIALLTFPQWSKLLV
jgi:mercuric ion transport protein